MIMKMEWAQILFMMLGNAGIWIPLIIWIKGAQEDASKENRDLIATIQAEMKDFHGRLCALEAKRGK